MAACEENCLQPGKEEASNADFFHKFLWNVGFEWQQLVSDLGEQLKIQEVRTAAILHVLLLKSKELNQEYWEIV